MAYEFTYRREVEHPFDANTLSEVAERVATLAKDADVRITITTHTGGSQRDPYPTSYTFMAKWEES